MLLVRKVKSRGVWAAPGPVDPGRASHDFELREGESYLSVYRVKDEEDAERILIQHALAYTTKDDHADYLLLEDTELGNEIELRHEPEGIPEQDLRARFPAILVDTLKARHFGLHELQAGALRELVTRLCSSPGVRVGRVTKDRIREARSRPLRGAMVRGRREDRPRPGPWRRPRHPLAADPPASLPVSTENPPVLGGHGGCR